MKFIHYNGQAILTSDTVADAVIHYAAVLGANGRTDTIDVPTFDEYGQSVTETLLVGPASQIALASALDDELELDDQQVADHLQHLTAAAGPARPVQEDDDDAGYDGLADFD